MHPWFYVRKILLKDKDKRKKKYCLCNILGIISFFVISILIAPLFHEFLHIAIFKLYKCYYSMNLVFDWKFGIYATLQPFCDLSIKRTVVLLGIGIAGNLFIAFILFLLSWYLGRLGKLPESNFFVYSALAFFSDPLFYLFATEGDLVDILEITERQDLIPKLPIIGFILLSLVLSYLYMHMKHTLEDYLRIKKEIEEAKNFLDEIKR